MRNVSPSQPPCCPCGHGPASTLHTSPAAVGSFLGPAGRLDGADKMHRHLHVHEGLNPCARPAAGVRQLALSCELSNKVVNASVEHLHGGKYTVICAVHDGTLCTSACAFQWTRSHSWAYITHHHSPLSHSSLSTCVVCC